MLRTISIVVTAAVLAAGLYSQMALAGIADTALPELEAGKKTYHLYSVPFAPRENGMEPIIGCTSTDTAPMRVCVQFFSQGGLEASNLCSSTSLEIAPGSTRKFAPNPTLTFSIDSVTGGVSARSARILATSKKLVCMALLVDGSSLPANSIVQLTIIKGIKQKAGN